MPVSLHSRKVVIDTVMEGMKEGDIPPPDDLKTDAERALWVKYTSSKLANRWDATDFDMLRQLIITQLRLDAENELLRDEPSLYPNPSGGLPLQNPRLAVTRTLSREIVMLLRHLKITPGNNQTVTAQVHREQRKEDSSNISLIP